MSTLDKSIAIPDFSLVVLIGATGSGKSTFAAKHFLPSEVISSDHCRALISDSETDQSVTGDAFDLVREIAGKRLKNRKLAVIDATNIRPADRKGWIELAREWHALPVAIVLDPGIDICIARNRARPDRAFGAQVVQRMALELRRGYGGLQREGFRQVWKLPSAEAVEAATVTRQPLWTDKRGDAGPFDIIGDIHGCAGELQSLLDRLGYQIVWGDDRGERAVTVTPPAGRKAVFVGDLVDRGPNIPDVLRIAISMTAAGSAYVVQGNHERKLERWLAGRKVTVAHGLQQTIDQLGGQDRGLRDALPAFLDGLRSHLWLDNGRLAVAHAGLKETMIGRGSGAVRAFALYGETTGEIDAFGLPVRADWAASYRGATTVVYGHTPVVRADWVNNTICIDTGCVFGGKLTALRWPEKELVDVPAEAIWCEPVRPLGGAPNDAVAAQADADHLLDIQDVSGRRWIDTELRGRIVVAEENASAALEVMSRFAIAPQWLAYLPPTMSPAETSAREGWLERPEEAFAYFRDRGVAEVVCEEKHMGSRAVIALCRTSNAARARFGVAARRHRRDMDPHRPRLLPRTDDDRSPARAAAFSDRSCGAWEGLGTDWLMPRRRDHAVVGQGGKPDRKSICACGDIIACRIRRRRRGLRARRRTRRRHLGHSRPLRGPCGTRGAYAKAWTPYVWPVSGVGDLKVAPFHLLASEGRVWFDRDHVWHMEFADRVAAASDDVVVPTRMAHG